MALQSYEYVALVASLCLALSGLAYYRRALTADGCMAAFGVGLLIGVFGDVTWLLLLLVFLVSSFAATRYKFSVKMALGVQEGKRGERGAVNVLANGLPPTAVAVLSFLGLPWLDKETAGLLFITALAVAAADTLASEIGVLAPHTYSAVGFYEVRPGTNGGVSLLGQVSAGAAALYTALVGWIVLALVPQMWGVAGFLPEDTTLLAVPAALGFLGCQLDSVLGATLETRGWISKKGTNFLSTAAGAVVALGLLTFL